MSSVNFVPGLINICQPGVRIQNVTRKAHFAPVIDPIALSTPQRGGGGGANGIMGYLLRSVRSSGSFPVGAAG